MNKSESGRLGYFANEEAMKASREKASREAHEKWEQEKKQCKYCFSLLPFENRNNLFCNRKCWGSFRSEKYKENRKDKLCSVCSKILTGKQETYCSHSCHQKINSEKRIIDGIAGPVPIKRYLIKIRGNKCEVCNWAEINPTSGKIPIELEHIDGNHKNNEFDNLKLLCPNCHSLTSTYRSLNKGKGRNSRMKRYNEGKSY